MSNKINNIIDFRVCCHVVQAYPKALKMFRVVERVHLERFVADCDLLYILTCVLVIAGAVAFSWGFKWIERNERIKSLMTINKNW